MNVFTGVFIFQNTGLIFNQHNKFNTHVSFVMSSKKK
jgi:hypothetical protein